MNQQKEALLNLERSTPPFVGCCTTRIVCRRGCPHEKRIKEGGRIFFKSYADAQATGYRPCLMCRPMPLDNGQQSMP